MAASCSSLLLHLLCVDIILAQWAAQSYKSANGNYELYRNPEFPAVHINVPADHQTIHASYELCTPPPAGTADGPRYFVPNSEIDEAGKDDTHLIDVQVTDNKPDRVYWGPTRHEGAGLDLNHDGAKYLKWAYDDFAAAVPTVFTVVDALDPVGAGPSNYALGHPDGTKPNVKLLPPAPKAKAKAPAVGPKASPVGLLTGSLTGATLSKSHMGYQNEQGNEWYFDDRQRIYDDALENLLRANKQFEMAQTLRLLGSGYTRNKRRYTY